MATPYSLVRLGRTSSTQDEASARWSDGPLLVVADQQDAGRGRSGRTWESAPRAIAASLAVRPSWPPSTWPRIPLVAGLSARASLGDAVVLKWPNDLVVDGVKVGGILVEGTVELLVIGLGVNLWWPSPLPGAGALLNHDPGPDAAVELAGRWAEDLLARLERDPDSWDVDAYRRVCVTLGQEVTWDPAGAGLALDVDPDGALVVEREGARFRITSGDVRLATQDGPGTLSGAKRKKGTGA